MDPLAVPLSVLAVAALVTFAAALVQGTIGLGFAVLCVPVLSLVDPILAPVPQLLVAIPMTLGMAWRERRHIQFRGVVWVLVGRLPGTALGLWLLSWATQRTLDLFIGSTVLLAALVLTSNVRVERNARSETVVGVASGVAAVVSSIGGPPVALLYRDADGPTLRATLAAIFTTGIVITVGGRIAAHQITTTDLTLAVWLLPALLLGVWLSRYTKGKVEGRALKLSVLGLSALAAAGLLARAALGG